MRNIPDQRTDETVGAPSVSQEERCAAARTRSVPGAAIAVAYSRRARQRRRQIRRALALCWFADHLMIAVIFADILCGASEGTAVDVLAAVTGVAFALWSGAHWYACRVTGGASGGPR